MGDFFDEIDITVEEPEITNTWRYVLTITSAVNVSSERYILDEDANMVMKIMKRDLESLLFIDTNMHIKVEKPKIVEDSKFKYISVSVLISNSFKCIKDFIDFLITMDVWNNHRNSQYVPASCNYHVIYGLYEYGLLPNDIEHTCAFVEIKCPLKCLNLHYDLNNAESYNITMKCISDMCKFMEIETSSALNEIRQILGLYDNSILKSMLLYHNGILHSYLQNSAKQYNEVQYIDCEETRFLKQYDLKTITVKKFKSLKEMIENPPDDVWITLGIADYQKAIGAIRFPGGLYTLNGYIDENEIRSLLNNIKQITNRKHEIFVRTFYNPNTEDVYATCMCGTVYLPDLDVCAIITYGIYGKFKNVKNAIERLLL